MEKAQPKMLVEAQLEQIERVETRGRKKLGDKARAHQVNFKWTGDEYSDLLDAVGKEPGKINEVVRMATKDLLKKQIKVRVKGEVWYFSAAEARLLIKELMDLVY